MSLQRILIFLFATTVASSASSLLSQEPDLRESEELLKSIIQKRYDSYEWEDKEMIEKEFEMQFLLILRYKESLTYPFSNLPIQIASSKDGKLKIYTWDTTLGGTWHKFAGIIQWFDESNNLNVKLLDDKSLESDIETAQNKWIGAIYSEVHPFTLNKRACYLALGWTTWGGGTQTKIVEIFEPHGKDIRIGKPIFQFEGRRRVRLLFVYARFETMNLEYNPETKVLKFDNLVEYIFEPEKERSPNLRKPDGTIRMLKFKEDHFAEIKQ